MWALFELYRWTIFCGALIGGTLALLGTHLAARDKAMQTVCVGQGATVGVLIGLGILQTAEISSPWFNAFGPFVTAFIFSLSTFYVSDLLVASRVASRNTFFAFLFSFLVALGYLISSLFPALESHMAQIYFGDLSTLTTFDAILTSILAFPGLLILLLRWKSISNYSFESAIFGETSMLPAQADSAALFRVVSLVLICFSVQFVGFLFTITSLFLPTALLSYSPNKGLKRHFASCFLLASVSTVFGFLLSLWVTRLPTVPAIVVVMFFNALLMLAIERMVSGSAATKATAKP